jgi:hypothetical protein
MEEPIKIVIYMQGGIIQNTIANREIELFVVDYDCLKDMEVDEEYADNLIIPGSPDHVTDTEAFDFMLLQEHRLLKAQLGALATQSYDRYRLLLSLETRAREMFLEDEDKNYYYHLCNLLTENGVA